MLYRTREVFNVRSLNSKSLLLKSIVKPLRNKTRDAVTTTPGRFGGVTCCRLFVGRLRCTNTESGSISDTPEIMTHYDILYNVNIHCASSPYFARYGSAKRALETTNLHKSATRLCFRFGWLNLHLRPSLSLFFSFISVSPLFCHIPFTID